MSQLADMAVRAPESSLRPVHLKRNRGTSQVSFKLFPILRLENFSTYLQEPRSRFRFLAVNANWHCSVQFSFSRLCGRSELCFPGDPQNS